MKMKKSLLAVLLSMLFMFSSFVPSISCYAVSISDINTYFDVQGKFYQILKRVTDISTTQEHQTSILNKMYDILEDGGYNGSRSGQGLEQSGDVTINTNGDVILSVDLQNAIREASQDEIDNSGYVYVYSYNSALFVNRYIDAQDFNAFANLLETNDSKDKLIGYQPSTGNIVIYSPYDALLCLSGESSMARPDVNPRLNWSSDVPYTHYKLDSNSHTYVIDTYYGSGTGTGVGTPYTNTTRKDYNNLPNLYYSGWYVVSLNTKQYLAYANLEDLKSGSLGLQPYYIGNDFSSSEVSTTQTITDSMLNSSISYGDISNYVNSYYVTNQSYPTTENVYNYINNYNGSGGSGGDSGNGSDDDDNNNIWDFLDGIGDFIGNLISALGNVLSGILSLLTDVIDMFIGDNGLPNIVGQLIQYFLPFLPTEIVQLIEFSLLLAIILGVIRLIRGH